jgi:hypothetical protein
VRVGLLEMILDGWVCLEFVPSGRGSMTMDESRVVGEPLSWASSYKQRG